MAIATVGTVVSTGGSPASAAETVNLFDPSARPDDPVDHDPNAVELGMRFSTDTAGTVTAIRYYKGAGAFPGTRIGHLWSRSGRLRATVTFDDETASGWQVAPLSNPVTLRVGSTYTVSYFAPNGGYASSQGFFSDPVSSGPLHAPGPGNGVYAYADSPTFPTNTWNASNYWVDVDFVTGTDTEPPPTTTTPPTTPTTPPTTTLFTSL